MKTIGVKSIKRVEPEVVYALKTTTGTFIADEVYHHNCGICNFNQGEQFKYAKALDLKYGDGTAEQLEKEAKEPKTWTIPELEQIIDEAQETIIFYERTDKWLKSNPKNQL
jgi:hypothetical protein